MKQTQETILVIDDNPHNLRLLVDALTAAGFRVRVATNGEAALESTRRLTPDMILLDVLMPGLDGYETLLRLRANEQMKQVPVIFLTALSDPSNEIKGREMGAVDYIAKPFQIETVLARVKAHLKRRQSALPPVADQPSLPESIDEIQQQERLRLLESVVINTNDAVLITEAEPIDEPGPRIIYANEAFTRMTGYSQDEVLGQTPRILQGSNTDRTALDKIRDALEQWQSVRVELINYTKEGQEFWIELDISPVADETGWWTHWVAIQRDITERKTTETALQETNTKLQRRVEELTALNLIAQTAATLTNLPLALHMVAEQMVSLFNAHDAVISLFNEERSKLEVVAHYARTEKLNLTGRQFLLTTGTVAKHVLETGQSMIIPQPKISSTTRTFWPFIHKADLHCLMTIPLLTRGHIIGTITISTNQAGRLFTQDEAALAKTIAGHIASVIEITQFFDKERRQRQEAENQNKELDAFAQTVAHDIKNPLGLVAGYADYLMEYETNIPPAERIEIIQKIRTLAHKSADIVDELLLLAGVRKLTAPVAPLDMAAIVEQTLQRLHLMLVEHQGQIILPEAWPPAKGYAPWVEEVWVNYVSNALKYGGRPPRLELGADPTREGQIRFWVRDNGPGIPAEAQEALFTEFTRLNEMRANGHGLGLSIVRRIIEKLGGNVGVNSPAIGGAGSEFYFTLPGVE